MGAREVLDLLRWATRVGILSEELVAYRALCERLGGDPEELRLLTLGTLRGA